MVAQAVAAAVAPAAIESARSEDGLINRAFKIVVIGALLVFALLAIYAISLISGIVDFGELELLQTGLGFLGLGANKSQENWDILYGKTHRPDGTPLKPYE